MSAAPPVAAAPAPIAAPRHVASLDGLRALAVFAVMAVHSGVPGAAVGWLGVDLFFVLSGFLITTLLTAEYERTGRIALGKFWARRFLRLMPAYWLYVGSVTLALAAFRWGWTEDHAGWTPGGYVASLWLYFVNYLPLGGIWEHQMLTLHLWSLAAEEQFYFAWLLLAAPLLRCGRPALAAWCLAALVLGRLAAVGVGSGLDTRGLRIVVGCALALSLRGGRCAALRRLSGAAWFRLAVVAGCLAVVVLATAARQRGASEASVYQWGVPAAVPFFALLVAMLWHGPADRLARALAWGPLAYLGTISYGLYLYQMACHHITWHVLTPGIEGWPRGPKFGLRLAVYYGLTVAVAALSYRFVEGPFLRLKARFR